MSEGLVRIFLDEDVHPALAAALRKRGYDVVHTIEEKRPGATDEDQLKFAVSENRCLVTFNVGDFIRLHNRWVEEGRDHCGIVVSKQLALGAALRRVLTLLQREDAESLRGQVRFL